MDTKSNTGDFMVNILHVERLRDSLLCGFAVAFILPVTGYSPALAQEGADTVIEEIVVTGSRLRRDDLSAPSPTVIVTAEDVRFSGRGTLEGLLNELPQVNPDGTANTANVSRSGMHTVDLRSLRPERTLVLVNGKRFTPANESGVTDLSRIPDALIERIEVITGGASAVYGSDAIAGAVNFIMRDNFEGLDLRYNYGQSFESDAETQKVDVIFGTNYAEDRGNVTVNVSWYDQSPALFDDRWFSAHNVDVFDGELLPAGSGFVPGGVFGLSAAQLGSLVGVDLTDFTTDRDFSSGGSGGCSLVTGVRFGRDGVPLPYCDPENRFDFNPGNFLLRPYERYSLSALANFEIAEGVEAYTELFFSDHQNAWNLNASAFRLRTSGQAGLTLPNYANNPVLFQATKDFLLANAGLFDPDGDGDAEIFGAARQLHEAGGRLFNYDITSYSFVWGLRGDLDFGGKDWQWDTYFQNQRAKEAEQSTGNVSSLRLSLASDVTVDPVTGEARCTNEFVGCIPVNFLGLFSASPEGVEFLTPDKGDQRIFDRTVFQASMNGDLFEMPAGPVAAAFGFEYREQSFRFAPGGLNENGVNGAQLPAQDVQTDVWELFTEFRIPLLEGRQGADLLALELAYRYSDYDTSGGSNTYKAAVEYAPVEWIRFRGAHNRAVRAPNLDELFKPQRSDFESGTDPCGSTLNPSQEVKDFCVLQGVPAADIDTFVAGGIGFVARRGGNPNLEPEESDTVTLGFVLSPPFIEGLNITVDWFEIDIEDAVTATSGQRVISSCFATLDLNSEFCTEITRFPNGTLNEVLAISSNFATFKVSGVDFSFDYARELPDSWGIGSNGAALSVRGLVSWLNERETQQVPIAPIVDCAGVIGPNCSGRTTPMTPDFGSKIDIRYMSGNLSVGATARTVGEFGFEEGEPRADFFNNKVPAETYLDIDANYAFNDAIQMHFIVKNVLDEQPLLLGHRLQGDSGVDLRIYDVIGARYTVGFRYLFD